MIVVYQITIVSGSLLLFLVQPLYAKRLLPALGGSPAVWNTVMVFFQTMLLIGYAYAHLSTKWLSIRVNMLLHLSLLAFACFLPLITLPADRAPAGGVDSILWLLQTLTLGIGLPFVLVSATSPLLQSWFSKTDHPLADDPYFLYSASNIGSFSALVAYPLIIERLLPVPDQIQYWQFGMITLVLLIGGCGTVAIKRMRAAKQEGGKKVARGTESSNLSPDAGSTPAPPITFRQRSLWLVCAAAASGWLLGVTQYLTTDLAPVPLLWIIPLSLYLLSFVLVFARQPSIPPSFWTRVFPAAALLLAASLLVAGIWLPVLVHLLAFFCGVMVCHGRLAASRPPASGLTEFYLWVSIGGVVGGFFVAIVAPLIFPAIIEYGIAIAVAGCLLDPTAESVESTEFADSVKDSKSSQLQTDRLSLFLMLVVLIVVVVSVRPGSFNGTAAIAYSTLVLIPLIAAAWILKMPRITGVLAGGLLIMNQFFPPLPGQTLELRRSYFGVHRVMYAARYNQNRLLHGSTVHGVQSLDDPGEPLAYYSRGGPLGKLLTMLPIDRTRRIGVVGLGSGAVAAYPNHQITFFEIDPEVVQIATNPNWFSYLSRAGISADQIVIGDGRASLAVSDQIFDVLLLDAFSSDAIPMHLLTVEAMRVYTDRLDGDGILLFHISNRHLALARVLSGLAANAGWVAYRIESITTSAQQDRGIGSADYVAMARRSADLQPLLDNPSGLRIERIDADGGPLWTDNFSDFLDVVVW